jgi:hypothetical protein
MSFGMVRQWQQLFFDKDMRQQMTNQICCLAERILYKTKVTKEKI